jgi:hypothetical protein
MRKIIFFGFVVGLILFRGIAIESCEKLKSKFKKNLFRKD